VNDGLTGTNPDYFLFADHPEGGKTSQYKRVYHDLPNLQRRAN